MTVATPNPIPQVPPAPVSAPASTKGKLGHPKADIVELLVDVILNLRRFSVPGDASTCYVQIVTNDIEECVDMNGQALLQWIVRYARTELNCSISISKARTAAQVASSITRFEGPQQKVWVRIGEHDDAWYLDLADGTGRAVKITPGKWEIVSKPPILFRRPEGMLPLPVPTTGGDLQHLRKLLNIRESDWATCEFWLVGSLRPTGPYAGLFVPGSHGTGKTTTLRMLRSVIDPNVAPVRTCPTTERDLVISAARSHVLAFDNLSLVPDWLSDSLCRLATGSGLATRRLFTDDQEYLVSVCRPVVFNSIEELPLRPDLLDRVLRIILPDIDPGSRRTEEELNEVFKASHPAILGALLTVVAAARADVSKVDIKELPRLADFARFCIAAEPHLHLDPGTFLANHQAQQQEIDHSIAEDVPVVASIIEWLGSDKRRTTTAMELLQAFDTKHKKLFRDPGQLPRTPRLLSGVLRRVAPNMKRLGIEVEFLPRTATTRSIRFRRINK